MPGMKNYECNDNNPKTINRIFDVAGIFSVDLCSDCLDKPKFSKFISQKSINQKEASEETPTLPLSHQERCMN